MSLTFASGATFTGTVTLAPDFQGITSANGTLTGYVSNTYAYQGTGTDTIVTTFNAVGNTPGYNWYTPSGGNVFGDWLVDNGACGTQTLYCNYISLSYDYTNGPASVTLVTTGNLYDSDYAPIGVDYSTWSDPMVSGSMTYVPAATPEPSTVSMLLLATGSFGRLVYKRRRS